MTYPDDIDVMRRDVTISSQGAGGAPMPEHVLIEHKAGPGGKTPVIKGTRVRVSDIARLYELLKEEVVVERIQKSLPHLTPAQIHAALDYWRENKQEVEIEIQQERDLLEKISDR
jgi:uncharacterized protein (DUF433 family)